MIAEFELISGKKIPYEIVARRPGDIAECWASPELAFKELKWKAKRNLTDMLKDAWNWQQSNPNGYVR